MVAIFDIDETLAMTFTPFLTYMNKKNGTSFNRFDFTTYDWSAVTGLSFEDLFKEHITFLNDFDEMSRIYSETGSEYIINQISAHDEIYALTDRDPSGKAGAEYLLDRLFPGKISKIIHATSDFGKYRTPKAEIVKKLDAKLFVDDSFDHIKQSLDAGVNAYLITRPWNKHEGIPKERRLKNLFQLSKEIDRIYK